MQYLELFRDPPAHVVGIHDSFNFQFRPQGTRGGIRGALSSVDHEPYGYGSSSLIALFVWLISRTFSANEQYFSLTTNQPTVLSAMAYQLSEQGG